MFYWGSLSCIMITRTLLYLDNFHVIFEILIYRPSETKNTTGINPIREYDIVSNNLYCVSIDKMDVLCFSPLL